MLRSWQTAGLVLLGVLALACNAAGQAHPGRPGEGLPDPGQPLRADLPSSMAALGDSLTAGYGSCITLLACGRNSWSTGNGTRVNSHYRRILADNPAISGHAKNFAVPGAQAADLPAQASGAVRAKVGYVTIMIGANDACRDRVAEMTPVSTFRGRVDTALKRLKAGLPAARILVTSIPDVYRLWELGHGDARAVRAWRYGVCPSLLADPMSTDAADAARRRQVRARIDAYDQELDQACRDYGRHCRYDGGSAHRLRFDLDLVNRLDYFHPNASGQDALAEATYPRRFTW